MALDLDGMPPLHDGEVLALMTGLRTHLGSEKPLILAGRIDRVSNLHRMLRDQPLDGVLVRLASGLGMAAPAALPRIGLSAEMQAFQGNCISLMSHRKRELMMRLFPPQVVAESSESIPLQAKRKNPALRRLVLQPSMGG